MKKLFVGIITAALIISVVVISAFSADTGRRNRFVDADGDGVCDNRGVSCQYKEENGKHCGNFTDEDGDGVCDNRGTSCQHREEKGRHCGKSADKGGNGVCDNRADRTRLQDCTGKRCRK